MVTGTAAKAMPVPAASSASEFNNIEGDFMSDGFDSFPGVSLENVAGTRKMLFHLRGIYHLRQNRCSICF